MSRIVAVAGSGFSGLVTTRVLSEHFDKVVVVERDSFPAGPGPRPGTPQDVHPHQLLTAARLELERLFPGITDDAVAEGARFTNITATHMIWGRLGWRPRYDSPLRALVLTRHLLDWLLRQRVAAIPNVEILTGRRAIGLQADISDQGALAVTGLRTLDLASGAEEVLESALVVDATGRTSAAPAWLDELGLARPAELNVNAFWGYTSCFVQLPEGMDPGFEGVGGPPRGASDPGPLRTRSGGIFQVEGTRRWIMAASGVAKDYPPSHPDRFREFLRGLGVAAITQIAESAELLSEPSSWRSTANRFRLYHEMPSMPERFLLVGDAVAHLNPVYGQGMSVAAWAARDLGVELDLQHELHPDGDLTGLSRRFQDRLARSLQVPWRLSTRSDASQPATEMNFDLSAVVDVEFMRRLEALAMQDQTIALRMVETGHLVRSPEWMDAPELRRRIEAEWDELGALEPGPVM